MQRFPKPFFRKSRNRWAVQVHGKQVNLGPDRDEAFRRYYEMMGGQPGTLTSLTTKPAVEAPSEAVFAIIDTFLEWCQKNQAERTYEWYLDRAQSFARTIPRDLLVADLKPFHVQEWVDSHANWSSGQKRGCITAIKRVFNWAVKQGRIDRSPIRHLEKPPEGKRELIVSPETFARMLQISHSPNFRDLITVAWETGCRPQEIRMVEARHVDLANGRWVFPKEESKGKKRTRIVYLTPVALEITKRLMLKHPIGKLFRTREGTPWVPNAVSCAFVRIQIGLGRDELERRKLKVKESAVRELADRLLREGKNLRSGKAMTERELLGCARKRLTERLAVKHGPKYCLYNLRHSWATRALENGVDAVTVSVLMGHVDTRMLSRTYQHLAQNPANLRAALNRSNQMNSKGSNPMSENCDREENDVA